MEIIDKVNVNITEDQKQQQKKKTNKNRTDTELYQTVILAAQMSTKCFFMARKTEKRNSTLLFTVVSNNVSSLFTFYKLER